MKERNKKETRKETGMKKSNRKEDTDMKETPKYITISEVAEMWGISYHRTGLLLRNSGVDKIKFGQWVGYDLEGVLSLRPVSRVPAELDNIFNVGLIGRSPTETGAVKAKSPIMSDSVRIMNAFGDITLRQISEKFDIPYSVLYPKIKSSEMPSRKIGKLLFYPEKEVTEWISNLGLETSETNSAKSGFFSRFRPKRKKRI